MSFFVHRVPRIVQWMYPFRTWHKPNENGEVHLTFDDGPVAGCTSFVLEKLSKHNMKATFFMVGDNVRRNPHLAKEVLACGHQVGNHTYHHANGAKMDTNTYLAEVQSCQDVMEETLSVSPGLFRPPYGRIRRKQAHLLRNKFQIVMWEVLSGDYAATLHQGRAIEKTMKYTRSGSIVLFHDQEKTFGFLKNTLPDYLAYLNDMGYRTAWI